MKKRHAGLNHIYRLIWNETLNAWVAVAETAKGRGRRASGRKLLAAWLALLPAAIMAAPEGGMITAGSGSIAHTPAATTITQQTPKMSIDWNRFSVGANESVHFNQPSSSSIALNRVTGQDASQIMGKLSANGQVFILNPHGVLFGKGAQADVGGLVASTLKLGNADFEAGRYSFGSTNPTGSVINQGTLTAKEGGYIALLAPEVRNEGVISARLGTATLASGNTVTLTLNNSSLLAYNIDKGALQALAENHQLIQADGGQVFMGAKAADQLSKAVVNNTGIIEAQTVQNKAGVIKLMGDMEVGHVKVDGTLDASAPVGGNGGFIETSAGHVSIADNARITTVAAQGQTGQWLVDPHDFTIAASGGDISGATLANQLATNNVTLSSTQGITNGYGDLHVNDGVTWSSTHTLSLNAERDVNVNAYINNTGHGNLLIRAGSTGTGTGTVNFDSNGSIALVGGNTDIYYNPSSYASPTNYSSKVSGLNTAWMLVKDVNQLQAMNTNLTGKYALSQDIDASATSSWNGGSGFIPIGIYNPSGSVDTSTFIGLFDGLNHTINNLTVNRPLFNYAGLFGFIGYSGIVKNLIITNAKIHGLDAVGGLAGVNYGLVRNVHVTGQVNGLNLVGGLIGQNYSAITDSHAASEVGGNNNIDWHQNLGGLVGHNNEGVILNSYSVTNIVTPARSRDIGGLVGLNYKGTIRFSYATGQITGYEAATTGGLIGSSNFGIISDSYSAGDLLGGNSVISIAGAGGLVGMSHNSSFSRVYAIGNVISSGTDTGGLIGKGVNNIVEDSYALGNITTLGPNAQNTGGLFGYSMGNTLNRVYKIGHIDTSRSSSKYVGGLIGCMNGGNINDAYAISSITSYHDVFGFTGGLVGYAEHGATINRAYAKGNIEVNITDRTINNSYIGGIVGGNDQSSVIKVYWDKESGQQALGVGKTIGNNAINDIVSLNSLEMHKQASFDFFNFSSVWHIYENHTMPLLQSFLTPLTIIADNFSKKYDGKVWTEGLKNSNYSNNFALTSNHIFGLNMPYGNNKNTGVYTPDLWSDQQGYNINVINGNLTITPFNLAISFMANNKNYDGTVAANISMFTDNRITGDVLALVPNSVSFDTPSAGNGKTVTVSGIALNGADASNYIAPATITTTADINKAPLTITANDHFISLPALPYSGGNGVSYSGFVNDEQGNVLGGMLTYAGSAQGAMLPGKYTITPQGLISSNYVLNYEDGTLAISQPAVYDAAIKNANTVSASDVSLSKEIPSKSKKSSLTYVQPAVKNTDQPEQLAKIVDCGMQLPSEAVSLSCN